MQSLGRLFLEKQVAGGLDVNTVREVSLSRVNLGVLEVGLLTHTFLPGYQLQKQL